MEAHGGYLCRLEAIDANLLAALARRALVEDQASADDASLLVSLLPQARVVRLAFDAPHTYGRKGARWYERHHALARLLSREMGFAVHAYVFDPDELEQVTAYGNGHRVGGEVMRYEDAELPDAEDLDDFSFERMKAKWPMGHLAKIFGIAREALLRIPRAETALLGLDGSAPRCRLADLFAGRAQTFRRTTAEIQTQTAAGEPIEEV